MSRRGLSRLAPLALVLTLGLSGCGGSDDGGGSSTDATSSTTSSADPVEVTVTRENDTFTPNGDRVELAIGQTLDLTITSDTAGEIHVHSTPEQEIAYEEGTSEHQITIDRPGVVEVESHDPDSIILQLEVS